MFRSQQDDRRALQRRVDDRMGVSALIERVAELDTRLVAVIEQQSELIKTNKEEHILMNSKIDKHKEELMELRYENRFSKRMILGLLLLLFAKASFEVLPNVIGLIK